jgi:hypothetical protein
MGKFIVITIIVAIAIVSGYVSNIVKLTGCDFKPSYKCEIIRGVGVLLFPMGSIIGFIPNKKFGE